MQHRRSIHQYLTIPNCLTFCRILGSVGLLIIEPLSRLFYILYALTGVTDVLDGFIARATKSTSEFGAKLDSVSDLVLYTVMILRIFPALFAMLPVSIWYLVGLILVLRLISYLVAAMKYHRFASLHTYGNKVTGALVFLIPFSLLTPVYTVFCFGVCLAGFLSSLEELTVHLIAKEYNPNRKSLFQFK